MLNNIDIDKLHKKITWLSVLEASLYGTLILSLIESNVIIYILNIIAIMILNSILHQKYGDYYASIFFINGTTQLWKLRGKRYAMMLFTNSLDAPTKVIADELYELKSKKVIDEQESIKNILEKQEDISVKINYLSNNFNVIYGLAKNAKDEKLSDLVPFLDSVATGLNRVNKDKKERD